MNPAGLITFKSRFNPTETAERFEAALIGRGLVQFARIDHSAGAKDAGLALPPTLLLIFGNAKGGTPLMEAERTIGIDLPLKVLIWQDADGATWLSYNDIRWVAQRHGIGPEAEHVVNSLAGTMDSLARLAGNPPGP